MRLCHPLLVLAGLCVLPLVGVGQTAPPDEETLIRHYNDVIGKLNADEFVEARQLLDAFEKSARAVKPGHPAHQRAQQLLKQVPELRLASYRNSAIKARQAADTAILESKLDEAAQSLQQFVSASAELAKLQPDERRYQQQRASAQQELAQLELVRRVLTGKAPDAQQLAAAATPPPQPLYQSAPGFALVQTPQPRWTSPLSEPGKMVVVQILQVSDATAAFAAQSARALHQQYSDRGLRIVSVVIDEGQDLEKLDSFVRTHHPNWSVLLNDRAEFSQHYLQGGYSLPAYVVVGRDRQAWWINGPTPLATTSMLIAKIHEEISKPGEHVPIGPVDDFPPALPIFATRTKDATPSTIRFDTKPAIMLVSFEARDGPYFSEFAALQRQYADRLHMLAVVRSDHFAEVRELAEKYPLDFYQTRWGLPECYGPNFEAKVVLVSPSGRVLKSAPLSQDTEHTRALLASYAALLSDRSNYPKSADAPLGTNLAHRVAGGTINNVSSVQQKGAEQRLNDGISGSAGWQPRERLPQEVTLSFLEQAPATFDRLVIDHRSGLRRFEVLVSQEMEGPFRSLGVFQADEHEGRQAFAIPRTEARVVKLRLLDAVGQRSANVDIGEIEIHEAADARPSLAERLATYVARLGGARTTFNESGLTFWEQTDFVVGVGHPEWRMKDGHLDVSGLPLIGELRATALLHAAPPIADFRLRATVQSSGNQAGGIVFGFRDWDNHFRLVFVQGHVQTGRAVGNSIRLERWHEGRLEVLGVHGEAFPHRVPIRVEVWRQGTKLAIKAQEQFIFALEGVPAEPGRVGFCAAGGSSFEVDDMELAPLAADTPWTVPSLNSLSTASGASLVSVNSQGDDQHPDTWASNLVRSAVFAPPAAWEAARNGDELPEAVFAFRDHGEVILEGAHFELPARTGAEARNLVRKVEVLATSESPLKAEAFRSLGLFTLQPRSGSQRFTFASPEHCRYVKLRLVENGGGDRFVLSRFDVRLKPNSRGSPAKLRSLRDLPGRQWVEQQFSTAADDAEQEPNDERAVANSLPNAKSFDAAIHFGETDWFRLPPPPAGQGLKTLHLRLDGLPWLRLEAALCNDTGDPVGQPLARFAAAQQVEQSFPFGSERDKSPALLHVTMPAASLALVLDTSGSMGGREGNVRAAVKSYLTGAAETEQIEVIEFNTEVTLLGRLPSDRQRVHESIEQLGVRGNTALYQALVAGMEHNQAVVLLSDGMNTVFETDFTEFCRRLGKRPVPIYVIGIGWDLYEYDANSGNTAYSLLVNLAESTGGQFYFSPESQQLETLYRHIAAEIRGPTRYRLRAEWETSERTVELATNSYRGGAHRSFVSSPLPLAPPELAIVGAGSGRGHQSAGMPPGIADLAPLSVGTTAKPAMGCMPSRGGELAALAYPSIVAPRALALPELVELRVVYKPPRAEDPALPAAVLPAFELIFDSSDSMKEHVEGKPKIEIARGVVAELADALPPHAQVGLRLYGHWGPWIARKTDARGAKVGWDDPRLNKDSDLVVPIGPLNARQRAALKTWIEWTQPRGKTPMVYSLLEARNDFAGNWKGPRTVILVSDGVETCGGKLEDLAKAYQGTGIDAVIHVIGFDIAGSDAEKQLREIAKIGRGEYYAAGNAKQLSAALRAAAAAGGYAVYDEARRLAARGTVNGDPVALLPGKYFLRLIQAQAAERTIQATNGPSLRLILREDGSLEGP